MRIASSRRRGSLETEYIGQSSKKREKEETDSVVRRGFQLALYLVRLFACIQRPRAAALK